MHRDSYDSIHNLDINNSNHDEILVDDDNHNLVYDDNHNLVDDDNHDNEISVASDSESSIGNHISLECPVCKEYYNKTNKPVLVLFPCGHSFCKLCINRVSLCPICRKHITGTATNWFLQSQIVGDVTECDNMGNIDPFYRIFIRLKDKIEELYIKYPDNRNFSSMDQKKLINEVLLNLKGTNISEEKLDTLLIPSWLRNGLEDNINAILNYNNDMDNNLIDRLPFCP